MTDLSKVVNYVVKDDFNLTIVCDCSRAVIVSFEEVLKEDKISLSEVFSKKSKISFVIQDIFRYRFGLQRLEILKGCLENSSCCSFSIAKLYYEDSNKEEKFVTIFRSNEILNVLLFCLNVNVQVLINNALLVDMVENNNTERLIIEKKMPLNSEAQALLQGMQGFQAFVESGDFKNDANDFIGKNEEPVVN